MPLRSSIALVSLLITSVTWSAPKPDPRVEAKAHYKAGEAFQRAKKYDKAVEEYLAAYELVPVPTLLFNVGQAYRLKGDQAKALEYYKRYLDADPGGELREDALAHIENLSRAIEEARQRRPVESAPARPEPPKPERSQPTDGSTKPAPEPPPPESATPPRVGGSVPVEPSGAPSPSDKRPGSTLRLVGLISGGVGVAAIGGGVFFGLKAKSLADDVSTRYDSAKKSDGESANRTMLILYGVGGAALVAGGVLYYLGIRSDAEATRVTVSPLVGHDCAAVSVQGVF